MAVTVSAVVLALGVVTRDARPALAAPARTAQLEGAANLLATSGGVVWSFANNFEDGPQVLRSTDSGAHWGPVLKVPYLPNGFGLTASYFLGPDDAWTVKQNEHGDGIGETTTVYGTDDGGAHWWHTKALPGDLTTCCTILFDQIYFANPEDGWVLGAGQSSNPYTPTTLSMLWWASTDGGRTWSEMPAADLPDQGRVLGGATAYAPCGPIGSPHLAFATARSGWFTEGDCASGTADPRVWRTTDGGRHWSPAPLPAPTSGWGSWDRTDRGGVDVGAPSPFGTGGTGTVLVPVAVGKSSLVVERFTDGGRTWAIASQVEVGAVLQAQTPAEWFQALSADDWLIAAPTELVETVDSGRHWGFARSSLSLHEPVYFTSLEQGFVQGSGLSVVSITDDGARTWSTEEMPADLYSETLTDEGSPVDLVQSPAPGLGVAAGSAGLLVSPDHGATWQQSLGPTDPVEQVDFVDATTGFALTDDQILRTTDGAKTWAPLLQPPAGTAAAIYFWSAQAGLAGVGTSLYLTRDAGQVWRPFALPGGWEVGGVGGNGVPGPSCFTDSGTGWVAASRGDRLTVLVTTDGGERWATALSPALLPGAGTKKVQGVTLPGADVELAACDGRSAWVIVSQPTSLGNMQGIPDTFDLLETSDLGAHWLDVLQSAGSNVVSRPRVPHPSGGPEQAGAGFDGLVPRSAVSPAQGALWLTAYDEDFGGVAFASTGDGGLQWSQNAYPGEQQVAKSPLPQSGWTSTAAFSSTGAWALFSGPRNKAGVQSSALYATVDAGAHWELAKVFPWPTAEG
jgi:photosystem II stability/assembly factor-like uncharacterized protein